MLKGHYTLFLRCGLYTFLPEWIKKLKMAELEDTRNVGIPVAHMGMEKNEYLCSLLFYKYISRQINSDHFISLMRSELCLQLNCHHECLFFKLWDQLKNMKYEILVV